MYLTLTIVYILVDLNTWLPKNQYEVANMHGIEMVGLFSRGILNYQGP